MHMINKNTEVGISYFSCEKNHWLSSNTSFAFKNGVAPRVPTTGGSEVINHVKCTSISSVKCNGIRSLNGYFI